MRVCQLLRAETRAAAISHCASLSILSAADAVDDLLFVSFSSILAHAHKAIIYLSD